MKLILIKNIPALGRADEVVEVSDAYARNFLLPKKLAMLATPAHTQRLQAATAAKERTQAAQVAGVAAAKSRLQGATIRVVGAGQPNGKLYQAIHLDVVRQAVKDQWQLEIAVRSMEPAALKKTGQQTVVLTWPDTTTSTVTVEVTSGEST